MAVSIASGTLNTLGAVLKLSSGTVVAVFSSSGSIVAYKDVDGTPSQLGSTQTAATVHGTYGTLGVDACVDSSDVVHVVSISQSVNSTYRDVAYNTISGIDGTPTWGTWETAATYTDGPAGAGQVQIEVDSSDYPRVLYAEEYKYKGTGYDQPYYTHDVGSGWITKERLPTIENAGMGTGNTLAMTVCSDDDIEAVWSWSNVLYHRRRNGSWGSISNWTQAAVACRNGCGRSTGDTIYRYGCDTVNDDVYENEVDTGIDVEETLQWYKQSTAVIGSYRWVVYIDRTTGDLYVGYNSGSGWTLEEEQTAYTYNGVVAAKGQNCGYSSGTIGYLFCDNTNQIYYDEFDATGGVSDLTISVNDTLTISDTVVGVVLDPLSPIDVNTSDSLTISDTVVGVVLDPLSPIDVNTSDSLTISDTVTVGPPGIEVSISDNLTVSDAIVGVSITGISDLSINVSDSLIVSDSGILLPLVLAISRAESAIISDTVVGVSVGGAATAMPVPMDHYARLRRN